MKDWLYNEFTQVGVDYSDTENTEVYDDQMGFRDYDAEAKVLVDKLGSGDSAQLTVIDLGCGTGAFSIHGAKYFKKVHAVDVSKEMLAIAAGKAKEQGIDTIEFHHSGFLNFQPGEKADLVITKWAFHHLPDYWKQAALLNIFKMLKPGGYFFLADVVFKFRKEYDTYIEGIIDDAAQNLGETIAEETKIHIRDEFSTFDWIIQGMIERAGFTIESVNAENSLVCEYLCRK